MGPKEHVQQQMLSTKANSSNIAAKKNKHGITFV